MTSHLRKAAQGLKEPKIKSLIEVTDDEKNLDFEGINRDINIGLKRRNRG
jgi:hypothetical protein